MAETPPQWRYAHTSQRVQRALAYLQSSCGGYPSSASSNSLNNQQHSQFSASYTHDQALQDLEECLIYDHMDLSVSGLQLLHSGAEQYLSQVSASHDHHHQQQYIHEQQEQQSQEQQPTPLHSLMPPLQLHSSLAINRIPHDTTLPATRAGMEVGGWGCASLTATQVAQLQSVLAMFQQQPQSQQQQQQTQQQQQQPSSSISSAADHAASLSTSAAGIQQKPPPAQTHPAAVWGLPPLKLITQLHVKLLPISVSYTEDTAMHSSSNSNSSSNIWQHSSEYQQHSRRAQQSRSEASACTLHLGAADAQVTLQGPDVEVRCYTIYVEQSVTQISKLPSTQQEQAHNANLAVTQVKYPCFFILCPPGTRHTAPAAAAQQPRFLCSSSEEHRHAHQAVGLGECEPLFWVSALPYLCM